MSEQGLDVVVNQWSHVNKCTVYGRLQRHSQHPSVVEMVPRRIVWFPPIGLIKGIVSITIPIDEQDLWVLSNVREASGRKKALPVGGLGENDFDESLSRAGLSVGEAKSMLIGLIQGLQQQDDRRFADQRQLDEAHDRELAVAGIVKLPDYAHVFRPVARGTDRLIELINEFTLFDLYVPACG